MSWIFGSSAGYINLSNDIVEACSEESIQSVAVNAGGATYSVGDIVDLTGGTSTITAQFEVTAESGGGVTGIRQVNDGVYTVPTGTTGIATTGAGDNNLTVDVTYGQNGWAINEDTTWSGSNRVVQLEGSGGGSDEIFLGWRTFHDTPSGYYNWEFHGMTGYDGGLPFDEQPGITNGFHDGGSSTLTSGCYLTALNSPTDIPYWLNVNPYRIIMVVKAGTRYFPSYNGWGNRFATSTEYPYPMCISGNTSLYSRIASTSVLQSGLTDPWRTTVGAGNQGGPTKVFQADNSWRNCQNATISDAGSVSSTPGECVVIPAGRPIGTTDGTIPQNDRFMHATQDIPWNKIIPPNESSGGQTYNLLPSEDSVEDLRVLFPTMIVQSKPVVQVHMELDKVFWVSAHGGLGAEDRIIENGEVYRVFPNGLRAENYSFFAIKEQ